MVGKSRRSGDGALLDGLCTSSLTFSGTWKELSEISGLSYMTLLRFFRFSRQYWFDMRSSDVDIISGDANRVSGSEHNQ